MKGQIVLLAIVGLATLTVCNASIDRSPVKVTNRNSGPSYDLTDDVERVKLPVGDESPSSEPSSPTSDDKRQELPEKFPRFPIWGDLGSKSKENKDSADESTPEIGRISIRRIFVVPMMPPTEGESEEESKSQSAGPSPLDSILPFMMMRPTMSGSPSDISESASSNAERPMRHPLWPMFTPMMSPQTFMPRRTHSFGSPPKSIGEREESLVKSQSESETGTTQLSPDPIQNLLRIMLESFKEAHAHMSNMTSNNSDDDDTRKSTDLDKSASDNEKRNQTDIDLLRPKKPTSHNETREDVVEIDGKKYLRKTVLNRHVGENMVFVTRRLIFVPLNETDSSSTTTENPISTTSLSPSSTTEAENKVEVSSTTTSTATSTSPKAVEPTTTTTTSAPSTSPVSVESTTSVKLPADKVKDATESQQ